MGPYYRPYAPLYMSRDSIVSGFHDADHVLIHGKVVDSTTSLPLPNAEIDIWQAGTNGLYDHEDPEQPEWNLRGRFATDEDGMYSLICLRPTPNSIPTQGPTGTLLSLLDRHGFRPGHIHFRVTAQGYEPLVTALYEENDKYLDRDSVFEVRNSVVVALNARKCPSKSELELKYDFKLVGEGFAYDRAAKSGRL